VSRQLNASPWIQPVCTIQLPYGACSSHVVSQDSHVGQHGSHIEFGPHKAPHGSHLHHTAPIWCIRLTKNDICLPYDTQVWRTQLPFHTRHLPWFIRCTGLPYCTIWLPYDTCGSHTAHSAPIRCHLPPTRCNLAPIRHTWPPYGAHSSHMAPIWCIHLPHGTNCLPYVVIWLPYFSHTVHTAHRPCTWLAYGAHSTHMVNVVPI
jgi:hypothetical protein